MRHRLLAALIFFGTLALPAWAGSPTGPQARSETNARSNPSGGNQAAVASIRTILQHGFRRGRRGLQDAGSQARSARLGKETDPRVIYAYGIVLLKHLKYRDALERFGSAVEAGNGSYLPAWKARIRTRFRLKQYDAGLQDAEKLARRLQHPSVPWSDTESRSGAHWLGRVVGYFALPKVDLVKSETLSSREAVLRKILGEDLEQAFDGGQASIKQEYDKQQANLNQAGAAIAAKQKDKLKQTAEKLESRRQLLNEQAETVEMTVKEWHHWLEEQLELNDKQLSVLKKDYAVLDAATNAISRQIYDVQLEKHRLSVQPQLISRRGQRTRDRRYENLMQRLEVQLGKYRIQYITLVRRTQGVIAQARSVIAKRSAITQRYQRATGQLLKTDKTLQKWSTVLKQAKKKQAAKAAQESPQARALARRLVAISTYLPLDPEAEKQRLLEEIGLAH